MTLLISLPQLLQKCDFQVNSLWYVIWHKCPSIVLTWASYVRGQLLHAYSPEPFSHRLLSLGIPFKMQSSPNSPLIPNSFAGLIFRPPYFRFILLLFSLGTPCHSSSFPSSSKTNSFEIWFTLYKMFSALYLITDFLIYTIENVG